MNPSVFINFSLLMLLFLTKFASQLVAVGEGGDDNGVMNRCLDKEKRALLHFKSPLQDPYNYSCLSTWRDEELDCCKWRGVTCNNQTLHVIGLDLSNCRLQGEIIHLLLNLTYLNRLNLLYNSFHGTIPTFIGSLTELSYLNLGLNNLNGTIPRSIGFLTKLRYLNLRFNNLNGTIPRSIGSLTELRNLDLTANSFHGSIPSEFGNLTNLQSLYLGGVGKCIVENIEWLSHLSHLEYLAMDGISLAKANHWVDVISSLRNLSSLSLNECELSQIMYPYSSFFNSSSSIVSLYLESNNLTSSMHHWLFPLTNNKLSFLDLSGNMSDGIPNYIGNLCSLESLILVSNFAIVNHPDCLKNLSGCTSLSLQEFYAPRSQFTGSLPDVIQKFSSLKYLELTNNQLNGTISEKLWQLPRLETLYVSQNNLKVPPITDHVSSLSCVKYIDLSSCKVGPRFPKWIQTLKNLTNLDLSNTGISDTAPLEFWDLWPSRLRYLNLSFNNISGKIPNLSSYFDYYSAIDLSSNIFHGTIQTVPSGLTWLNLSRNKLSGGIFFLCQIVDGLLQFLDLSHNFLSGQLPDCLWHFKQLLVLNLGHNYFFGRLPPSIGSLLELEVLYLYNNSFFGELSLSLKNCTSLKSLNLGANKFYGNVPAWIGENLLELYVLILRSNNFSGTIPLRICQLPNLQILDLSINNLHGTIPSCLDNLTSMTQQGFSQGVQYYRKVRGDTYAYETYGKHALIEWQGDEHEFFSTLKLLKSIDLSSNNLTGQTPQEITKLYDLISLNLSKNALFGEIPWKIGK